MDSVEHDHAFVDFRAVILELSAARIAAPDSQQGLIRHLFHLLDNRLQLGGHWFDRPLLGEHRAIRASPDDDGVLSPLGVLIWKILAKLSAAALFSKNRRARDGFGN